MTIMVPLITSIISGMIAFASARGQNRIEIEKVLIQQKFEMNQFIEQQKLEIEKIKEIHKQEIEKLSIEIDKQAELYEKNVQIDMAKDFYGAYYEW